MNTKLGITILYVRDTARQAVLPRDRRPARDRGAKSPTFVTLHANNNTLLGLQDVTTEPNQQPKQPGGVELGFEVADVNATWREWKRKGVQLLSEPADFPFGHAFDAQDPEGHPLSIYRPRQ